MQEGVSAAPFIRSGATAVVKKFIDDISVLSKQLYAAEGEVGLSYVSMQKSSVLRPYRKRQLAKCTDHKNSIERELLGACENAVENSGALYCMWPKPKQVRAERRIRHALANGGAHSDHYSGFADEVLGVIRLGCEEPQKIPDYRGRYKPVISAMNAVLDEDKNGDDADPYWEKVKDSLFLEPRPGLVQYLWVKKEDGFGNLEHIEHMEFRDPNGNDAQRLSGVMDSLIGKKVIFVPIKDSLEDANFLENWRGVEMPFEFEVREYDVAKRKFAGDAVGQPVKAEILNPFTEEDGKRIQEFFLKWVVTE